MVYVEVIRNIPLLLQLLFWYNAVLAPLPQPRNSHRASGAGFFLNSRGLFMPQPLFAGDAWLVSTALVVGIVGGDRLPHLGEARSRRRPAANIRSASSRSALVIGLPVAGLDRPRARRRPTRSPSTCRRRAPSTCAAACRSCRNSWRSSSAS